MLVSNLTTPRVLVCVITGGRPKLSERPTKKFLAGLIKNGWDVEWVIREDHVDAYERDEYPFNVYTQQFANEYARTHWRHPTAEWKAGGFFGAFPGREWAMRTAENRGYDLVLQLDDNVIKIGPISAPSPGYGVENKGPEYLLNLGASLAMSTNAHMLGFQLASVIPKTSYKVLRPGYPYSVFFEKTGPGRMPYYGPFEDDIMHALEYALNGGEWRTAGVIDGFTYAKESSSSSGMRKHYNTSRGLELVKRYPNNARLSISNKTSSPVETERGVRHILNTNGFTPIKLKDSKLFWETVDEVKDILIQSRKNFKNAMKEKIRKRAVIGV